MGRRSDWRRDYLSHTTVERPPRDWDLLESYPAAMDPEACSRACVVSSTCKGSLYSAQPANRRAPCFLYSGATEPVLEDMDRVLWMSYRKVSPLDPVDCKEELELVGELEDKASSGGEEGDGGDNGGGEEEGENGGNDGGSGTGPNDAVCPRNDENVFSYESRRWELHCDRYTRYGTGANNDLDRDSPYLNIAECIRQCSQIPKCRMVYFHKGLRTCFFATRPGTLSGRAPDYDAAWVLGS
ncbi:uncharacterized protein BO88DRAFT_457960 [Aspergillus vadensis CBS 113365]|uniref:Apple domain-containing protein n=1 Tax=Aspergillus vadensis (strain CBS 113365 / IMI 142717 / IBT 24658) TaxID=1448311 RepID=A0A319AXE7_ASPVC|nr:hypothetical protein BO88DRAFT_457960 [Aspergillus vadensis CBS 113365]PYH64425.1 hypothetical protein BO88DRAFT_457960 [Aspergillus vadensis CBS 113365]